MSFDEFWDGIMASMPGGSSLIDQVVKGTTASDIYGAPGECAYFALTTTDYEVTFRPTVDDVGIARLTIEVEER